MDFKNKMKKPPGTFVYTGSSQIQTKITHVQYSKEILKTFSEVVPCSDTYFDWISVEGLSDTNAIRDICASFEVETLVIEDILNPNQRNKFEVFDKYIFMVQQYSYLNEYDNPDVDYISILLFSDKILTFTESKNRFSDSIFTRLENKHFQISQLHEDYLFYVFMDMIYDESFNLFHHLKYKLEYFEKNIFSLNKYDQMKLYNIRKNLVSIRNNSSQTMEYASPNSLLKNSIFRDYLEKYLLDLEDHIINLRDKSIALLDTIDNIYTVYSTNQSNKINEIMKTLTIFSAIFIPLSFITGIFGMNFTNFPILQNQYGFLIFIAISAAIPITMLIYFKTKKWF